MRKQFENNLIVRTLRRLHLDRSADMVQKILIIACIALPILVILLVFRNEIKKWFTEQKDKVSEEHGRE